MAKRLSNYLTSDFPALQLVRTGSVVRFAGKVTLACLVVSVLGMIVLPWQQTARGVGTVMALDPQERPQVVTSPSKGVVKRVQEGLREGSYVEKGELLLQLAPFASDGVSQVQSQVAAIEAKQAAAESNLLLAQQAKSLQESAGQNMVQSLKQDLEATRQKWNQSKSEVLAAKADLEDKRNQWAIAKRIAAPGVGLESLESLYSKEQAVESQFNKVVKAQGAVDEAYAMLMAKEKEIISKEQEIDIKNRAAAQKVGEEVQKIESIRKELTDLKNKADEFDRLEVRAPKSGYIQQWNGLVGSDTVKEGDQLFVLVPDTESLSVEMLVSGNDMPLVQEGDRVRLQFEGWPAVQFVGWPSVAVGTFGGKVNRVFPTDDGRGFFRVVVTPDRHFEGENDWPDGRYLRQGVRSNGWVLLKQVPLGYEIWRQLNGFPPIVADSEPKGPKAKEPKINLPKL